ncbi:Multicopper oxidase type 3 [Penicillium malachiteum]|uniref:Multicopper oxidase type 3 n=1 Tax=Penicillium malachiteum TaxID=1324776 RepID=UPI00254834AB|nr:Multicopper oxidase type 3 [Penicillium malachiteum]KAJ5721104.1 Multicopper oxidase type 3 [Penicillium malachiteum]
MKLLCFPILFCLFFVSIVHANSIRSPGKPLSVIPRGLDNDLGHKNSSSSSHGNHGKGNPCAGNTPNDRSVWCDYNIDTDYSQIAPDTGVTREYWLEIKQVMLAPDGFERPVWTINGTVPGPTIIADWGDWVVIHVTNNLGPQRNGTTLHWHGIRQNYTSEMDGVPSITQCPITPGKTMTYKWRAEQYGSTWYHAHIGLLAWEGVYGGIVINGPATANYDVDKGSLFLGDWTHRTVDELYVDQEINGPAQNLSNGLINGTNVYQPTPSDVSTGHRFTMKVNQGTSYRLRLVSPSIDTFYQFSIDGHSLEVIAMDLVPIVPFKTDVINIAMGQRYDVIVTANQGHIAESFWMRAVPTFPCSGNDMADNIRGIMHYGQNAEIPTTKGFPVYIGCNDIPMKDLVPWVKQDVAAPFFEESLDVTFAKNKDNYFRWEFNSSSLNISWEDPTLLSIYNDEMDFTNTSNVIELPGKNQWVYLLINTTLPVAHPIHLHGHDFSILGQGIGVFDGYLVTKNPPRRDTAMLPAAGWLLVAFQTDNPGAWLMHCHIGWHVNEGLALQFVERYDEIRGTIDYDLLDDTCSAWRTYDATKDIVQEDSGV